MNRWLTIPLATFLTLILGSICHSQEPVLIPKISSEWWQVTGNPDLGKYTSEEQQPVDFGVWQAADGTWQLWSCIRKTKCGGNTRLFYRWQGNDLTNTDWEPMGIAMMADPNFGEHIGGMQAPYVITILDDYYMFYGDWEHICLAKGFDGKTFSRMLYPDNTAGMFSEGEGNNARDAMVIFHNGKYYCYYTAHPNRTGAIYCRTSTDLRQWSDSTRVSYGGSPGTEFWSAECPHVVQHDGWFYLFRTHMYGENAITSVYRSKDPLDFGKDSDEYLVTQLQVAAPEIIKHNGKYYIAALMPSLQGIQIAEMSWVEK